MLVLHMKTLKILLKIESLPLKKINFNQLILSTSCCEFLNGMMIVYND